MRVAKRTPVFSENPAVSKHDGKSYRVDAHQSVPLGVLFVDAVDGLYDAVDGLAGELIAKDIKTDLLVALRIGTDSPGDAFDGTRVAERSPST